MAEFIHVKDCYSSPISINYVSRILIETDIIWSKAGDHQKGASLTKLNSKGWLHSSPH